MFNCLTTLSVGPAWAKEWDARFEFPLYCVADFLKLPSLQRFGVSDFRDTHALDQYSPWTLLPRVSKLKNVSLSSCLISSQVLKTLLGCFERLEKFSFFWKDEARDAVSVTWPGIREALLQHRDSLHKLDLGPIPGECMRSGDADGFALSDVLQTS